MYWQKLNSFPKQPTNINWVSRYGNENRSRVTDLSVIVNELDMEPERFQELDAQGWRFPTVRDYEILMSGLLTETQNDKYHIAQYLKFDLDYPDDKTQIENYVKDSIQAIGSKPTTMISEIFDIQDEMDFGVKSEVELIDQHYDLEDWKESLRKSIQIVRADKDADQQVGDFMQNTLTQLKLRKEAGEETGKPSPEMVTLEFSPWGFFPNIPKRN